ncbi:MAG: elongation factor Ts [Gammaproteobacteria bacterium]|nr:elongation factor Ts [Gammaproteobacteria bacterium]OUT96186.1 MAG: translation elongation factor Ts [Gammaproteobacteria bacterium TMED36]|tara:strand:- start:10 stop:885 length:876 start_codon:yes stop_codon:yes gene_type:complete
MEIKAIDVKKLREETNAGMMDCKKALLESEGDFEKAKLLLREKGQSKADKKSGRTTAQGLVRVETDSDHISILEVNCETDFAAKDALFDGFVSKISKLILTDAIDTIDQLNEQAIDEFDTVEDFRKFVVSKIGENITVRRFERIPLNGTAGSYIHGEKIASVAIIENGDEELARDIAMHVAASQPEYIQMSDIPEDLISQEKKILTKQVEDEGKPAEILPKIVDGKLNKQMNSITLMGQEFIKDPDLTVAKLLERNGASVVSFTRYEVGEGVEVEDVNFADEVKAQVDAVN